MSTNTKLEDTIIGAIDTIVNRRISQAGYDKTILATIVSCVDQTTGKYKVKYQDSYWIAYSNNLDNIYTAGSNVYVLIPSGDISKNKTILGTVQNKKSNYITVMETNDRFIPVGENVILDMPGNNEYGLCSYKKEDSQNENNNIDIKVLYKQGSEINSLAIVSESIKQYIHNSTSFILGAKIRTNLKPQQRIKGNYGIELKLNFNNADNNSTETKTYLFDINDMEGNPYFFPNPVRQYAIFELENPSKFDSIESIVIFAKDFPDPNDDVPIGQEINDIFFSQIEFGGSVYIQNDAFNTQALILRTPKGYIFNAESEPNDTRDFVPEIWIKGKPVNLKIQKVNFYWFIQNVTITDDSRGENYNKYGRGGWQKLDCQDSIFSVRKNQILTEQIKYKCVAVYNNIELNKQFKVVRTDAENNITIESSNGTKFYNNIGTTTLTCKCKNTSSGEDVTTGLEYVWCIIDSTGKKFSLKADEDDNSKISNINVNSIVSFATYCCSIFKKQGNSLLGTASITLTNSDKQNDYSLIIENGDQVFKYNTFGISPTSGQNKGEPQTIPAISFKIYNDKGEEIDITNPGAVEVIWTMPSNNTLLVFAGESTPFFVDDTINFIKSYSNLLTFPFTIAEQYNFTYTRNNIELKVKYNGLILYGRTNFTFLKQGENGTNGTEYIAKLTKQFKAGSNMDWGYEKPAAFLQDDDSVTSFVENSPFILQFWHNGEKIFAGNTSGRTIGENKDIIIVWELLKNKYSATVSDTVDWYIDNVSAGTFTPLGFKYNSGSTTKDYHANIIQAAIKYDNLSYYVTNSMIMGKRSNSNYRAGLKYNSGFRQVIFGENGKNPQYCDNTPFEIIVEKYIDNEWIDISSLVNYTWSLVGSVYDTKTKSWKDECYLYPDPYLNNNQYNKNIKSNQYYVKVIDGYDGLSLNQAVICQINITDSPIATLYLQIPIHMMLNRYGHQNLNDWNGNGITIDNQGGYILSPQIGAGVKHNDNSFTGIFMGKSRGTRPSDSESGNFSNIRADEEIGLFGYTHGTRSIFLDAETGKAQFGTSDKAKIIIDPSQKNTAGIYSGNYDTDLGTGMAINFSQGELFNQLGPWIRFGSGNFSVDKDGYLIAKGGGSIAGWNITDQKLYKDNVGMSSSGVMSKIPITTFTKGTTRTTGQRKIVFWAGNSERQNFAVTPDGHVYMSKIQVGSSNDAKSIFINLFQGENNDSSIDRSAIFSNYKTSKDSSKDGFYLGTDGLALGPVRNINNYKIYDSETDKWITSPITVSNFQVDENGTFFAKNGYIGTANFGWQLERNFLGWNKTDIDDITNNIGVYLGKDGLSIGRQGTSGNYHTAFKVDQYGNFQARKGSIGLDTFKWIITDGYLGANRDTIDDTTNQKGIYFGVNGISIGRTTINNNFVPAFKVDITNNKYSMNLGTIFRVNDNGVSSSGKLGPFYFDGSKIYYYYNNSNQAVPTNGNFNFEVTQTSAILGPISVQNRGPSYIGSSSDLNSTSLIDVNYPVYSYRKFVFYSDTQFGASANHIFNGYVKFTNQVDVNSQSSFNINAGVTNFNKVNMFSGSSSKTYFESNASINFSTPNIKIGGLNAYSVSAWLGVDTYGNLSYGTPSSKRYKNHIRYLQKKDVEGLLKVQPVLFTYKKEELKDRGERQGLYAQDLDENYPNAVMYGENHIPENWDPKEIIPGMLLLIQQHEKEIKRLKEIIKNGK